MIKHIEYTNIEKESPSLWRMVKYANYWLFNDIKKQVKSDNKLSNHVNALEVKMPYFWIAGGFLRDYFTQDEYNDIDIFFNDEKSLQSLLKILKSFYPDVREVFQNNNVTKVVIPRHNKDIRIDLIKHYFITMMDCIASFDFTITMIAVDVNGDVMYDERMPFDILKRRLVINTLPYPLSSLQRLQKFIMKGYTACNSTFLLLSKALKEVDFDSTENTLKFYPDGTPRFVNYD